MKKSYTLLGFLFAPLFLFAQEKTQSLDQQIDESFGNATNWFTNAILAEIPITENIGIP